MAEEATTFQCAKKDALKLPLDAGQCWSLGKESASDTKKAAAVRPTGPVSYWNQMAEHLPSCWLNTDC